MIRKQDSPVADMEEVFVVQIDYISIPLSQSQSQSKALTLFNSMKTESWGSLQKKNLKLEQCSSWGSRKEIVSKA